MKIEICSGTMVVGVVMIISICSMIVKISADVQTANVRAECYKTQQAAIAASQPQPTCDK